MPFKRALTISLVINLFFLALCLIFGDLKFGAIDDYFMAARLTGALGTDYNPHLIFVNAIYGYALLPLYHLFPAIGWYYIGEMFSVFLSFTVIGYVLLQKCGERWGTILAALFTALFASDFYLVVQFTQCASILSAAGMLLFAYGIVRSRNNESKLQATIPFIIAIFLMLWGSVMRWQAFLMGLPFFCLGLLFILRGCWSAKWHVIAGLIILFAGAFGMHVFDQKIYQSPVYEAFNKFQGPRVALGDNSNYNQNAVYEDAEELGLSGKDYHMLTEWVLYDTDVFSVDSIKRYTDLIPPYRDSISTERTPQLILNALSNSLHAPLFWTWFILCIVIYTTSPKKFLYLWASLALVLILMAYLLAMGRLVYRVESGFWLYASVLAIPLIGRFSSTIPKKILFTTLGIIAIANTFTYATSGEKVRDPSHGSMRTLVVKDSTDYTQVFNYIDNQPDKIFLLSMNAFMRFSHHRNPPYLATPTGSFKRTVSFGYWTPYLPEITEALNLFGITNPIKDVIKDNVIILNEPNLVDFLQRHYYDSVAVDTLKSIGEMTFFKYRLVNPDVQQAEGK
ncbi:hypothetical protein [Fibrobacter sp. UWB7]|uniref:hypothetical protein n=1 Tax=Fibrobacter sp. UWB7 TaxID=1896206 RepID=UPI00091A0706|nr:hypothetical protein [Fibrobacter sp. UWB7]SHM11927.1 hypothetical protein SAMN05720467_0640 [Fibrobacter sp. UWB7]